MNCSYCKEGRNNLCLTCIEIPPNEGMFQEYYLQSSFLVHKIPDNLTLEHGAIAEPLACALHAVKRASISPGQKRSNHWFWSDGITLSPWRQSFWCGHRCLH